MAQEFQIQPHQVSQNVGTKAAWDSADGDEVSLWKEMTVWTLIVFEYEMIMKILIVLPMALPQKQYGYEHIHGCPYLKPEPLMNYSYPQLWSYLQIYPEVVVLHLILPGISWYLLVVVMRSYSDVFRHPLW